MPKPPPPPANRIAELRKARGWSMDQLAQACRPTTTATQINKLEKGRVRLNTQWMQRIADALEVHPQDLIDGATAEERSVIEIYRGLSEEDRRAFLRFGDAMRQPAEAAPANTAAAPPRRRN